MKKTVKSPLVTIIVPVYNAERYLRQSMDSMLNQTLSDFELICVDDGSDDTSLEILNEYAAKDSRITVIQQQNQYAGVARNNGMKHAKGEYLCFFDSDDFVEPDMLEKMYGRAKETDSDLVVCDTWIYKNLKQRDEEAEGYLLTQYLPEKEVFNRDDIPMYIFNFVSPVPWNKMFKRSFVEKEGLQFQNSKTSNDVFFVRMAQVLARRISCVNERLYHLRRQTTTNLQANTDKSPLDGLKAMNQVYHEICNRGLFEQVEQSFCNALLTITYYHCRRYEKIETKCLYWDELLKDEYQIPGFFNHPDNFYFIDKPIYESEKNISLYRDYCRSYADEETAEFRLLKHLNPKKNTLLSILCTSETDFRIVTEELTKCTAKNKKKIEILFAGPAEACSDWESLLGNDVNLALYQCDSKHVNYIRQNLLNEASGKLIYFANKREMMPDRIIEMLTEDSFHQVYQIDADRNEEYGCMKGYQALFNNELAEKSMDNLEFLFNRQYILKNHLTLIEKSDLLDSFYLKCLLHSDDVYVPEEAMSVKIPVEENEETAVESEETAAENEETAAENEETTVENEETAAENEETTVENEETTVESEETAVENEENQETVTDTEENTDSRIIYSDITKTNVGMMTHRLFSLIEIRNLLVQYSGAEMAKCYGTLTKYFNTYQRNCIDEFSNLKRVEKNILFLLGKKVKIDFISLIHNPYSSKGNLIAAERMNYIHRNQLLEYRSTVLGDKLNKLREDSTMYWNRVKLLEEREMQYKEDLKQTKETGTQYWKRAKLLEEREVQYKADLKQTKELSTQYWNRVKLLEEREKQNKEDLRKTKELSTQYWNRVKLLEEREKQTKADLKQTKELSTQYWNRTKLLEEREIQYKADLKQTKADLKQTKELSTQYWNRVKLLEEREIQYKEDLKQSKETGTLYWNRVKLLEAREVQYKADLKQTKEENSKYWNRIKLLEERERQYKNEIAEMQEDLNAKNRILSGFFVRIATKIQNLWWKIKKPKD